MHDNATQIFFELWAFVICLGNSVLFFGRGALRNGQIYHTTFSGINIQSDEQIRASPIDFTRIPRWNSVIKSGLRETVNKLIYFFI